MVTRVARDSATRRQACCARGRATDKVEQVFTPAAAYDEVFGYLPPWPKRRLDTLLLACAALPITVVERSEFQNKLSTAKRRIGKRDPDDVDVLALALTLKLPVWSNDNDFDDSGVEVVHDRRTGKTLGIQST